MNRLPSPYRYRKDAKLTRAQVIAAHKLHIEGGLSIRELGRRLWEQYGYASPRSCANSLSDLFATVGLPARDRIAATVAASTTHGRGARRDKAAYKRWHRETFGPWPSDVRYPNGERGKVHRTRDEARGELRGGDAHEGAQS